MSTRVSGILIPLFSKTLVKNYKIEWTSGSYVQAGRHLWEGIRDV